MATSERSGTRPPPSEAVGQGPLTDGDHCHRREDCGDESDARYQLIDARDKGADGRFYYAVVTTGIYCLPSCASRSPRRENVRYFASREDAELAGYRPCKRCRPDSERDTSSTIATLCRLIERSTKAPKLGELARQVGWSVSHLQRTFANVVGLTPKQYALAMRQQRLRNELMHGTPATRALRTAGYESPGRFHVEARRALGMSCTQFARGGPRLKIRFALGSSSLGEILVAATEVGICAVFLGDDPDQLVNDLMRRFPKAMLCPADPSFQQLVQEVVCQIEHPESTVGLPLDLQGTAFQKRVWSALLRIRPGQRWSYTELARSLDQPTASRAVATACAQNPVAVAVPCHRVVRADGSLAGYRWGLERKRWLLDRERQKPSR